MKAPQRVETGKFYVSHHETESETLQRLMTLFAKADYTIKGTPLH